MAFLVATGTTWGTLQLLVDSISGCLRSIKVCPLCLYQLLRGLLVPRLVLVTENLALRQQLLVLHRSSNRPRLRHRDRLFWIALSQLWRDWRSILVIVKPETVIKWHRQGFKCYWRWKSRSARVGRPKINQEVRVLIRRMWRENPTWGVPRIQAELHLLGNEIAESTVAKYRDRSRKPPSQTWKSFFGIMLVRSRQLIFSPCLLRLSMSCTASSYCCTIGGRWSTSM